jgi:heme-degrading monooxygenase HmoA
MEFAPEKVNAFIDLFTTTRHKIASFEGCKGVTLLNDVQATNIFFTHSLWESEEHLNNYRHSELFKDTWTKTKAMFCNKAQAWSLTNVETQN